MGLDPYLDPDLDPPLDPPMKPPRKEFSGLDLHLAAAGEVRCGGSRASWLLLLLLLLTALAVTARFDG